jgi:hypothetical protein
VRVWEYKHESPESLDATTREEVQPEYESLLSE